MIFHFSRCRHFFLFCRRRAMRVFPLFCLEIDWEDEGSVDCAIDRKILVFFWYR